MLDFHGVAVHRAGTNGGKGVAFVKQAWYRLGRCDNAGEPKLVSKTYVSTQLDTATQSPGMHPR